MSNLLDDGNPGVSNFWEEMRSEYRSIEDVVGWLCFSAFECVCSVYLFVCFSVFVFGLSYFFLFSGERRGNHIFFYRFTVATVVIFAGLFAFVVIFADKS